MVYRESGQFKTTYANDMAMFPITQDRWGLMVIIVIAVVVVPVVANNYWITSLIIPFLIFALAALGLNVLTGYAGQLSVGHADDDPGHATDAHLRLPHSDTTPALLPDAGHCHASHPAGQEPGTQPGG